VTAVGLSDEHPSRERAADGGRELREIMQGQQRTERAMLGSTASPPCGEQPAASALEECRLSTLQTFELTHYHFIR
jgi:hypothetical protein